MLWTNGRENVMERDFFINNDTFAGSGLSLYFFFYGMATEITIPKRWMNEAQEDDISRKNV